MSRYALHAAGCLAASNVRDYTGLWIRRDHEDYNAADSD